MMPNDLSSCRSIHEFNDRLNAIAERCADEAPGTEEDAIGLAALAETTVRKIEEDFQNAIEDGDDSGSVLKPDRVTYNTLIKAWGKACAALAEDRGRGTIASNLGMDTPEVNVYTARDAASRATTILKEMERRYATGESETAPDCSSYNAAIDAWAKCRIADGASNAEQIMQHMQKLYMEGYPEGDDVVKADKSHWMQVSPDTVTYNAVIDAWSHANSGKGLNKATTILDMMEQAYEASGDARIKPNIRTVNSVVNAYAKRGNAAADADASWDAAEKAERLVNATIARYEETGDEDYRPDVTTYTSVIDAYGRCGDVQATERAEALLEHMEHSYRETGDKKMRPNFRTYTAVITAWSKTRDDRSPHRAEELVERMERLHAEAEAKARGGYLTKDEWTKPNTRTYTAVINCWARSRDNTKPQRALRILKKMNDLAKNGDESVRPNLYTYNSAIDACAKCRGTSEQQAQALKIAFAILKAIQVAKNVKPNHVTYGTLIKATGNLMPAGPERNDIARAVFEKCCKAGMVEDVMLKHLRMAVDGDVLQEVLKGVMDRNGFADYSKIPPEWTKNVK